MRIDALSRLRHLLQTLSFCLVVASLNAYLRPDTAYPVALVYSLSIGTSIWALIDFGRDRVDPHSDVGWPRGWRGLALPAVAIPLGYAIGVSFADYCTGGSSWRGRDPQAVLRDLLITLVASIVISYFFYSRGRSAGLSRSARQARQEAAEARLKLLEAQLEPHMLFNTLANLRALVATDTPRAEAMLDHFIAYLRATLDGARAAWHPLGEEFARLDDYLALMAVRMGDRLHYSLQLPPACAGVPVPPLLLQPLVENAIRHGLEPQVAGGRIDVIARYENGGMLITVRDTGVGTARAPDEGGGFGTSQVRDRLASAWGPSADLRFRPVLPHGTQVLLRFPVSLPVPVADPA